MQETVVVVLYTMFYYKFRIMLIRSQMTERGAGASLAETTSTTSTTSTVHRVQGVTGQSRLLRVGTGDGGQVLPQLKLEGQLGDPPIQQPHRAPDEQQSDQAGGEPG